MYLHTSKSVVPNLFLAMPNLGISKILKAALGELPQGSTTCLCLAKILSCSTGGSCTMRMRTTLGMTDQNKQFQIIYFINSVKFSSSRNRHILLQLIRKNKLL